ncbi:MAG: hypothetical protein DVS81_16600 [Candidatus Accumulibacter meliphilus]|uniref:Alpha/beta hydrolase n=1 Tax=Candidatus Accumulibacter meliphilus TaxID=2211374 RepID=A0A369XLU7_9PROT|nr:MAG: hypothetical protein DVS81_16600 [Candidatus Accumulibacter meliphilus]
MNNVQVPKPRRAQLANGLRLENLEQGPRGAATILLLHSSSDSWRSFEPVLPSSAHVIRLS